MIPWRLFALSLLLSALVCIPAYAQQPVVGHPVKAGATPPVRSMKPPEPKLGVAGQPPVPIEVPMHPRPGAKKAQERSTPDTGFDDPVVQESAPAPAIPTPTFSFEGISNDDNAAVFGLRVLPPDPNGDVGPSHYVQAVNLLFEVFDKATGASLLGPMPMSTLFQGLGTACDPNVGGLDSDGGDPIVLYDHLADRWFLSQFTFVGPPFHLCLAISQTGDPTGAYFVYDFVMPNNKFPDYPKYGVWSDAYYMSANQFNAAGTAFQGVGVFAFERTRMLLGDASASFIYIDLQAVDPAIFGMLPADLDGPAPPAGTPNYFTYFTAGEFGDPQGDALRIFAFHADFVNPASATFSERAESPIATAAFDPIIGCGTSGRDCIPQPAPATSAAKLDAIADRLMHRLQYRNFGTHESLVTNHTVDVGTNRAGIRYYELRRSLPGGTFAINEQASFSPDTHRRWMGSAAMDQDGNLAVGYSVSSSTVFPSMRYAGRLATDPPGGLFQGEAELQAGSGSQTDSSSRWGDYSMLAVDPVDDCTFWYTNEYYPVSSAGRWHTRIGSFKFATCGGVTLSTDLAVTKADSPDPVVVGSNLTYTVVVMNNGPDAATGVTVTDTLPTGLTFVSASTTQGSCSGTTTVSCSIGSLANGASATVTIVATVMTVRTKTNTASVTGTESDPNTANNSATATTTVNAPDLVETSVSNPPATATLGSSFSVTDTASNQGTAASGVSTTRYYLSLDTRRNSGDRRLTGSRAVPGLAVGATSTGTVTVTIPGTIASGTYFLLACTDDTRIVLESKEGNNCRASATTVTISP